MRTIKVLAASVFFVSMASTLAFAENEQGGVAGSASTNRNQTQQMEYSVADRIASSGECSKVGILSKNGSYNSNSRTWWIDIKPFIVSKGCHPACVINSDGTSSVNWRCTGVSQPAQQQQGNSSVGSK